MLRQQRPFNLADRARSFGKITRVSPALCMPFWTSFESSKPIVLLSESTKLNSPVVERRVDSGTESTEAESEQIRSTAFPFTVRIVRNEEQLLRAIDIRAEAYERHWPNLYAQLRSPEAQDRDPNSLIFLAEMKGDGQPVGTLRVDTNLSSQLQLGPDIRLPQALRGHPVAYVTRLGVKQGSIGSTVKLALFKSLHRYCLAKQLSWMLVGIRPPGDRDYVRLGFSDVFEPERTIPIGSSGGIPVRLMSFEVGSAERRWKEAGNPLYNFMFSQYHPDIEIFSSVSGMWTRPRRAPPVLRQDVDIFSDLGIPLV